MNNIMGLNIFDQFTYLHFSTGIIAYFFSVPIIIWLILHTLFEITENSSIGIKLINNYFKFWPGGKPHKDSLLNIIGDTIGTILGWLSAYGIDNIGEYYNWYKLHIT